MDDSEFSIFSAPPPRKRPPPVRSRKHFGEVVFLILLFLSVGGGVLAGLVFVYSSNLPGIEHLQDYRPDVMTELYADDGSVLASFALEHRVIVQYHQIPAVLRNAIISVEDKHFESHWGIDVLRIVRAAITDLLEWRRAQGASTLTQQLSRRLFLTPEKSWRRKIQEALLAIQMERHFTKAQIFTMYCNIIPLGSGNYGFEAASEYFFGKHLDQLTLPEAALLAGLPRSPTAYSPVLHPERCRERRDVVLAAMLDNHKITREQYLKARAAPVELHIKRWSNDLAPYFVEDVRQFLEQKYGAQTVQSKGLRVYTTLDPKLQRAAQHALREGLREDDKRRGWRGPEQNILRHPVKLSNGKPATLTTYWRDEWNTPLKPGERVHGLVMEVRPDYAEVRFGDQTARLTRRDFAWTHRARPSQVFARGDVDLFHIRDVKGHSVEATLDQVPTVQGALVAIDNVTGGIKAMVGGYDYATSKFNRARQAQRQAGSSFKVYVYAEALLQGASPFDTIADTPLNIPTVSGVWAPHDYDNKFEGNITLLHALAESRNIPAVRLLAQVGIDKVIKLCRRFGITSRLVPNLPLALGASDVTLLEHASAFTTFPDDGVHIAPRMVTRVTNYDGRVIDDFEPHVTDVLPAPIARLETSMLREVINSGTGVRAKSLAAKYPLAGKTGTTNDFADAWFIGFSPRITCGVWVGFDDHRSLGPREEGARVALPIWIDFMTQALKGLPPEQFPDSPLLTSPDQVKQILASTGTESLMAISGTAGQNGGSSSGTNLPPGTSVPPRSMSPAVLSKHPAASPAGPKAATPPPAAQPRKASSVPH